MKEPREILRTILDDPYATDASKQAACKLYNGLRRQVTRRKRANERRDVLAARIAELEAAMAEVEVLELREAAMRWEWLVRHASLGFDAAPSWDAVVRLPVFDSDDQTITALVDRGRAVVGDA